MKGRITATVWKWAGINAAALMAVLLLAYGAGSSSGGLGLRDFGALPQSAGFQLLGALFLVVAVTVAFVILLGSRVLKPVQQLAEFSERVAQGDFSTPVEIHSEDDFALIAENCNRIAAVAERAATAEAQQQTLDHSLSELMDVVTEIGRGDLFARANVAADASAGLAESLNRMLENLVRMVDKAHDSAAQLSGSARQGLSAGEAAAGSALRQQQEMSAFGVALAKFTTALHETGSETDAAVIAGRRALQVAEQGMQAMRGAAEGAGRICAGMQAATARIKSLGDRSLQVYEVINIINDTHLMALNAAIEASRAAQSGKGLDVLDAELRRLGEHSRASTKDVVTLLKAIQNEANEAAAVIEQANRMAESGARATQEAVAGFEQVTAEVQESAAHSESASQACRERLEEAQAMTASLQNAARLARQSSESVQKAVSELEQVVRSVMQLHESLARLRTTPTLKAETLAAELAAVARR